MAQRQNARLDKEAKGPTRRCLASGAEKPKEELLRFVLGPDGTVIFDVDERLPGRGFWLSPDRDMINTACARKLFSKAARAKADTTPDFADHIIRQLRRKGLETIGLARRSGQAVAGFDKVVSFLKSSAKAGVLLAANDGSADGRRKIEALAPGALLNVQFSASELGNVFGRERTVHAVLASGKLAAGLGRLTAKLEGLTTTEALTD